MPRIRTIKPELFLSETLAKVSIEAERTFTGLLTQADDKGYLKDSAAVLNGALWPCRPEHTVMDMRNDLDALVSVGVLCRFTRDGKSYLHFPSWDEHQKISHPSIRNPLPSCEEHDCTDFTQHGYLYIIHTYNLHLVDADKIRQAMPTELIIQYGITLNPSARLAQHWTTGFTNPPILIISYPSLADAAAAERVLKRTMETTGVPTCTQRETRFSGSTEAFYLADITPEYADQFYAITGLTTADLHSITRNSQ